MIYHVAIEGNDANDGSREHPFRTIQHGAESAFPGDRVLVHGGEYREWIRPPRGGASDSLRIVFEAASGERVIIKGSERIQNWEREADTTVWKAVLPNSMFGEWNPYKETVWGDWMVSPQERQVHLGDVYLNGKSFYEAFSMEALYEPEKRLTSQNETWLGREERILEPEQTIYQWYAVVKECETVLYANFHAFDPNKELTEINVRKCCFFPDKTACDYITVRGFEMAQAATPWAPPTAAQFGMIGPNWSKGWIIEDNRLHDAKCSAICLGKEERTGDNLRSRYGKKAAYHYQMEAVFHARALGWSRERIGSHTVRNNCIHDCGQNGIVGHMGGAFSRIYGNEIYRIAKKHEFYGHEIAGIKLHAAIDVEIRNNYIHECSLGTWLDWEAQGARVSANLYERNDRDLMIEVTHGPCLVDNNIFLSPFSLVNAAQGTAFVHNLVCGFIHQYPTLDRATPYHFPHTTELKGAAVIYGGDDRILQNIFFGGTQKGENLYYGTRQYEGSPVSLDDYVKEVESKGNGDLDRFVLVKQPVYSAANAYFNGAPHISSEEGRCVAEVKTLPHLIWEKDGVYLEMEVPGNLLESATRLVTTELLGLCRLSEEGFENTDGSPLVIDHDLTGSSRGEYPHVGPLEHIEPGYNKIMVWKRRLGC